MTRPLRLCVFLGPRPLECECVDFTDKVGRSGQGIRISYFGQEIDGVDGGGVGSRCVVCVGCVSAVGYGLDLLSGMQRDSDECLNLVCASF